VRPARSIFEQSADFRCSAIAALVRLLTSDMHATCPGAPTSIFILLEVNLTQTIQDISIVSNSSSTDSMSTVACNAFRGAYDKHTGRAPWKRQVKTALERSGVMRCTVTVRVCAAVSRRAWSHHSYRFCDPVEPRRRISRRELLSARNDGAACDASTRSAR